MTSQLYVSQISHVAKEDWRVVKAVPEHSVRRGRRIPERWSGGRRHSPRALVEWSRKNTGLVVEEAVPERWSGGRGGSPRTLVEWSNDEVP
jgi:hypothetical protein